MLQFTKSWLFTRELQLLPRRSQSYGVVWNKCLSSWWWLFYGFHLFAIWF